MLLLLSRIASSCWRYPKHWVGILGDQTPALDLVIVAVDVECSNAHLCSLWSDHCHVSQMPGSSNIVREPRLF